MDRKVLVSDPIARDGIDALAGCADVDVKIGIAPDELLRIIGDYDALIVRSETKVTAEVVAAADKLLVIGRAGAGVDNIDVDAATKRGIIVVNTPQGNTISAAEHTIGLMLSLSRLHTEGQRQPEGRQVGATAAIGVEVRGKTLGIIGLGQIGRGGASGPRLEIRVLANDPFVSDDGRSR